jgi:hypothetical protein
MKKAALLLLSLLLLLGCLYVFSQHDQRVNAKGRYARIPIEFVGDNALIEIEIEEKKYPIKLDLGAACQFAFFSEVLESISEKQFIKFLTTTDIRGNQYKIGSYSIPCIKAKNLECQNALIQEELKDFVTKGARLWRLDNKNNVSLPFVGRMGRDCFKSNNLFLDFPNSMMFVTSNLDQLKMDHWFICDLFETSFEMGCWGIILSIETDMGIKRFILDTGTNISILRESQLNISEAKEVAPGRQAWTTKKFVIGKHDFGPFDLSLFDMTAPVDGLLGLDFLRKYAIYLDFEHNKAFIGPSSKTCGAIIF